LSVYDLWLIVICLYNRVILDDFIPEFCNFEVGHSRILQFSRNFEVGHFRNLQFSPKNTFEHNVYFVGS